MLPTDNLPAPTDSVAVPKEPEPTSDAAPSKADPAKNDTLPAGAALPLAGLTVAVNSVVPVAGMLAGAAVSEVVVATDGTATVTVADAVEPLKLPVEE